MSSAMVLSQDLLTVLTVELEFTTVHHHRMQESYVAQVKAAIINFLHGSSLKIPCPMIASYIVLVYTGIKVSIPVAAVFFLFFVVVCLEYHSSLGCSTKYFSTHKCRVRPTD